MRLMPLLLLTACGPSQELASENDELRAQVDELKKTNKKLEDESSGLSSRVRSLEAENERLKQRETYLSLNLEEGHEIEAVFETNKGTIHCTLFPDKSPKTVLNFVQLAEGTREWLDPDSKEKVRRPLYDGTIFHRVIPKFMIQGGDPVGDGTGGPGYRFEDEVRNGLSFDKPGLLAMANSGTNTNGSQFFITDRSTPTHLSGKHTIFGACEDQQVVQNIAEVKTGTRDRPVQDVVLTHVAIVRH